MKLLYEMPNDVASITQDLNYWRSHFDLTQNKGEANVDSGALLNETDKLKR